MNRKLYPEILMGQRAPRLLFRRGVKALILVVVCCSFGIVPLLAQANVGGIVGTVSDSSNAAISGATVTLVNPATNEKQETLTNTAGEYVFSLVRPATYNISAVFKARIYLTPERI